MVSSDLLETKQNFGISLRKFHVRVNIDLGSNRFHADIEKEIVMVNSRWKVLAMQRFKLTGFDTWGYHVAVVSHKKI